MNVYPLNGNAPSYGVSAGYGFARTSPGVSVYPVTPQGGKKLDTLTLVLGGIVRVLKAYGSFGLSEYAGASRSAQESGYSGDPFGQMAASFSSGKHWKNFADSWTGDYGRDIYFGQ